MSHPGHNFVQADAVGPRLSCNFASACYRTGFIPVRCPFHTSRNIVEPPNGRKEPNRCYGSGLAYPPVFTVVSNAPEASRVVFAVLPRDTLIGPGYSHCRSYSARGQTK